MRLVRCELVMQLRRPRTWVALGFVVLVPIVMTIALKANPPDAMGDRGEEHHFFSLASQTGLIVPVAALELMSQFFLVVVLCLFAGDAVASEAGWGNLRYLLVRPVPRGRLLATKLAVAALFGLVATALVALAGLVAGVIAFGWHPLELPLRGLSQSPGELLANTGLAVLLVTWGLAGVIAFGFMLSTMTDNAAGAGAAVPAFRLHQQLLQRAASPQQLDQRRVILVHAHESAGLQIVQHVAVFALAGVEPFQCPARTHLGMKSEAGSRFHQALVAGGGYRQHRSWRDHDRPAGLLLRTPPLDPYLHVSQHDQHAVPQRGRLREPPTVDKGAVARSCVTDLESV